MDITNYLRAEVEARISNVGLSEQLKFAYNKLLKFTLPGYLAEYEGNGGINFVLKNWIELMRESFVNLYDEHQKLELVREIRFEDLVISNESKIEIELKIEGGSAFSK